MTDNAAAKTVKLASSDNEEIEVPLEVAKMSVTMRNIIDDLGDDTDAALPLPTVTGKVLEKIVEYCKYHHAHPGAAPTDDSGDKKTTDNICAWDKEFCNVDQPTLFELILAANFLDIKSLLDVCCKTVANALKACKDPEDIRKYLNIKNDFTPDEEEQLRKENEWCLEKN